MAPKVAPGLFLPNSAGLAPVSSVFPADVNFHLLEIGIQAIQLSPYHAGLPAHRPGHLDPAAGFLACSCPRFTFRLRVSHQTQAPPFEFLPAMPGIQPGATWRTRTVRSFPVLVAGRVGSAPA